MRAERMRDHLPLRDRMERPPALPPTAKALLQPRVRSRRSEARHREGKHWATSENRRQQNGPALMSQPRPCADCYQPTYRGPRAKYCRECDCRECAIEHRRQTRADDRQTERTA